jgi:hypothetical protein
VLGDATPCVKGRNWMRLAAAYLTREALDETRG